MSDVLKNIADAVDNNSTRRGFSDLFADSKAALDKLQAGLGGLLPSMPGMPVAKFGDLAIGIDMHPTVTPPSPVMPVPHVGKVYDLMADIMAGIAAAMPPVTEGVAGVACNILKGMAPTVKVHNQWIAQAGIGIVHLPAFVLHPAPLVSGMSESEMWMGSATVLADGAPCSTLTHPALSCNLVGIPTIPRKGKPKKVSKALLAPTSMLSTITSVGKPVLVGGPPTIDMFALAMKFGLKGLGKMWKKLGDKFQDLIDRLRKKGKNRLADILQPIKCKTFGEPSMRQQAGCTTPTWISSCPAPSPSFGNAPITATLPWTARWATTGTTVTTWASGGWKKGLSSSAMPTDGSPSCPCWNRETPILTARNNCTGCLTGRVIC